ncbi:hypothetical protein ABEB36_010164 [Hypothenemus hampei]|uniref:Uncharacterized protein n=1 Tax=Hypothenemus hampei TaxID=57062 RepID=A0ABD1EIY5_HYPHA
MSTENSSSDYEDFEQKYIQTKSKLKKAIKYNDRYTTQIQKLTKQLNRLETENKQLEEQVNKFRSQKNIRDSSESDVSSSTNIYHRENVSMIDLVHAKNEQISGLLKDLEGMENENIILKDKLTEVKDQLAIATKEITDMTQTLKNEEIKLEEKDDKLRRLLDETEHKLTLLKSEMNSCTIEIKESTKTINQLKTERNQLDEKLKAMRQKHLDKTEQLKKAHERCQTMQGEVEFSNKLTKMFEKDLSTLKDNMKENGQSELVKHFDELQSLKIEKLLHEKQIIGLVKDVNKVQEMFNSLDIENASLRKQFGLTPEDQVEIDPLIATETTKQKRMIEKLEIHNKKIYDENIQLKLEVQYLKRQQELLKKTGNAEINFSANQPQEDRSIDVKALSEENEALRKGLHEILTSVQITNSTSPRELKTDMLERLLKALDAKHISGWYHPAMRLQAELHSLEGINKELREQLYEARNDIENLRSSSNKNEILNTPKKEYEKVPLPLTDGLVENLLNNSASTLEELKIHLIKLFINLSESEKNDLENILENEFEHVKKHIDSLHINCTGHKIELENKLEHLEKIMIELKTPQTTNLDKFQSDLERRKYNYLFNENVKLQENLALLKSSLNSSLKKHSIEVAGLLKSIFFLRCKLNISKTQLDVDAVKDTRNSLNEYIKKYRQLLDDIEEQQSRYETQLQLLKQCELDLRQENEELKEKFAKILSKNYQELWKRETNSLVLTKKLANTEVEALSEKNRADHTNNLYKLVKEQLKKSEEKFMEFSKYSEGLLEKNAILQERVAKLEDELSTCISPDIYKESELKIASIVRENEILLTENNTLLAKISEKDQCTEEILNYNKEKDQELLGLKHKIIDLSAVSDDKAIIDNLWCDLRKARLQVQDYQMQLDFLKKEVSLWEGNYKKLSSDLDEHENLRESERKIYEQKIGILNNIIVKQRIQYYGCVPLSLKEHFVKKSLNDSLAFKDNLKTLENQLATNQGQPIDYLKKKIEKQTLEIEKLEKELFDIYELIHFQPENAQVTPIKKRKTPVLVRQLVAQESLEPIITGKTDTKIMILRNVESQTEQQFEDNAKIMMDSLKREMSLKENQISEFERILSEKEKELIDCSSEMKLMKEDIMKLEDSLKQFQDSSKIPTHIHSHEGGGDGINEMDEQIMTLKETLKEIQGRLKHRDMEIIKYQTLLKEDRDKHSLAAANLQKELIVLRKTLATEQQNSKSFEQELTLARQKSIVVDTYMSQVRALEKHLAELHTELSQVKVQLQNSHQEASRWRQIANDRLLAMQELGKSLNDQHNKEISNYKSDYQKLKKLSIEEPAGKMQQGLKYPGYIEPEILKLCKEKDGKIEELLTKIKQIERETETPTRSGSSLKGTDAEMLKLTREHETLRNKYESMIDKEQKFKEEIKELKDQLAKRSILSTKSLKSEKNIKDRLQKKINQLEQEIETLTEKLRNEQYINEKHKLSANEDFQKWKKQKLWQENCQKYKKMLQDTEEELQKVQQTCTGYKLLIERLEREKINLENRVRSLKAAQNGAMIPGQETIVLKAENEKLSKQLTEMQIKMDVRQQGGGSLGAALMQEKLEAQERKIAILELSSKGSVEMRNEFERLQTAISNLQKTNLCLEAENLELKMDVKKYDNEVPRLHEQIQHLESYIEVLKAENEKQIAGVEPESEPVHTSSDDKKVAQLERTVFILKRVVEKLQAENKRLANGKRPISERFSSEEKLRRDNLRLKDEHAEDSRKIKELEARLQASKRIHKVNEDTGHLRSQLDELKEQLHQKSQLLDKVKNLLHSSAAREKQLLAEIAELRRSSNVEERSGVPSPIEEISEVSSDA